MNTIRIYEKDETSFNHNGICIIKPLSCNITRNLHDYKYFVELEYQLYVDEKWKELQEDRIIHVFNERFDEYFRIMLTRKTNNSIYVYAEQEFFTLERNFVVDTNIVGKSMNQAINQLLSNTDFKHKFKGTSNIGDISNCRVVRKNVVSALIGSDDNTILNRWGIGELDMNKYTFCINDKIGEDRGYTITYGKKTFNGTFTINEKPLPDMVLTLKNLDLEIGSALSTDVQTYITETLTDEVKQNVKLNLTSVNTAQAGSYQYTVTYNGRLYTGTITIFEPQKTETPSTPTEDTDETKDNTSESDQTQTTT